jgi:hypothetical protein
VSAGALRRSRRDLVRALTVKNMNTAISLALLVGGIILLVFGWNASQSTSSEISRVFTGNPTDESMWMLIGGAVLAVLGLVGLLRGSRKS